MNKQIMAVGIAAVDIINSTDGFPAEDSEIRAIGQSVRRGGNACNTLCVLAQLGHHCHWTGTLADNSSSRLIEQDLKDFGINSQGCQRIADGHAPTSYITLNRRNGSRTIVHHRQLPELSFDHFQTLSLEQLDWIHFEGRNIEQTAQMMALCRRKHPKLPVSLEVEKPRDGIQTLFPLADYLIFSRHYAQSLGLEAETLLQSLNCNSGQNLVCTWGESGAWLRTGSEPIVHIPSFDITQTVDSIGAGDTFIAGLIHAILKGDSVAHSVKFANKLAAVKCSQNGFSGLTRNPLIHNKI